MALRLVMVASVVGHRVTQPVRASPQVGRSHQRSAHLEGTARLFRSGVGWQWPGMDADRKGGCSSVCTLR